MAKMDGEILGLYDKIMDGIKILEKENVQINEGMEKIVNIIGSMLNRIEILEKRD